MKRFVMGIFKVPKIFGRGESIVLTVSKGNVMSFLFCCVLLKYFYEVVLHNVRGRGSAYITFYLLIL